MDIRKEDISKMRLRVGICNNEIINAQTELVISHIKKVHKDVSFTKFDIGGGSTEFVRVKNGKVKNSQSVSIGSLNLFHSNVSGLWPEKKEQKAITKQINKKLNTVDFPKKSPEKVCCVGGTCRAILNIVNYHFNKQENNRIITREEFDKILKILTKHDITSRNYILKLCPDRVHTIIPGMMVVKEIMDRLNCKELWVSRYGVREGYLCKNFLMTGSTQEVTK